MLLSNDVIMMVYGVGVYLWCHCWSVCVVRMAIYHNLWARSSNNNTNQINNNGILNNEVTWLQFRIWPAPSLHLISAANVWSVECIIILRHGSIHLKCNFHSSCLVYKMCATCIQCCPDRRKRKVEIRFIDKNANSIQIK